MNIAAARHAPSVGVTLRVSGVVQGVGLRPTVWRLATALGLTGEVRNDGRGVLIRAWGPEPALAELIARLRREPPPLARIDAIERAPAEGPPPAEFRIADSEPGLARTGVPPDAATCARCVEDTLSPFSRRYRYPFTNCTHCGPRLTVVRGVPYDRARTSMAEFTLCAECAHEYHDPADRRFHAQPNACHACGPRAWLERLDGHVPCTENLTQLDDVDAACTLIARGEIVAIKGLGGFQLACDATSADAVARLRARKHRHAKPFALMARDLEVVRAWAEVSAKEARLLASPEAPIVILQARAGRRLPEAVAPGQRTLGFMLPYTPLHHLLLRRMDRPVVMTSGNVSDEPQCIDNGDARTRLAGIADYALMHDRPIVNRVDDSVVRVMAGAPRVLRRARGYAPAPLPLPPGFAEAPPVLAMGAEVKNTFCLLRDGEAILSQHIGDLEDARTLADYRHHLTLYRALFDHRPQRVAVDRHPRYLSTALGEELAAADGIALDRVQHHHAHVAACLAENGHPLDGPPVIGVALDGLGYGEDGALWGGEFLEADYRGYRRLGTFRPVAMPGGARAIREPWRNTYAHLTAVIGWAELDMNHRALELVRFLAARPRATLDAMIASGRHAPAASSCGRLFDAVAAALGLCREHASHEAEPAMALEAAVDDAALEDEPATLDYPFAIPLLPDFGLPYIEPVAMWRALLGDLHLDTPRGVIAARFHRGLARAIAAMVRRVDGGDEGPAHDTVALSGGVFQNRVLLELVIRHLEAMGYRVLSHRNTPANDGGLALGQAVVAAARAIT